MKYIFAFVLCLVITMSACLPTFGQPSNINDAVATSLAATKSFENAVATLVAQTMVANQSQNPLPIATNSAATASASATATATKPPPVTATASINLNCRSGPAVTFDLVVVFNQGASGNVIGKNTAHTPKWYQLELEDGKQCWVADDSLTVTGDVSGIPEKPSPPTPTPVPPASLWAGTWTVWQNQCMSNDPACEEVTSETWIMTGPNTMVSTYTSSGCTWSDSLTVSSDGSRADGIEDGCGVTWEVHLKLDPNHNQFRGKWNIEGNANWDGYYCGARNGFGKPSPPR